MEQRLTKPRTPRTSGMVERFDGRIADVLKTHRFNSREVMEQPCRAAWSCTTPVAAASPGPQDACAGHEGVVESLRNRSTRGHAIVPDFKCRLLTIYDSFARMAAFKPKQCAASNQCIRTPWKSPVPCN